MVGFCHRPGSDAGPGRALVTFGPNGHVQNVVIQGKLGSSPVGECVANQFRNLKVPPFAGNAVTVAKSFIIPD